VTIQLLKNGLQLAGFRGEATVVLIGTVLILSILLNQFLEKFVLSGRGLSKIKRENLNQLIQRRKPGGEATATKVALGKARSVN